MLSNFSDVVCSSHSELPKVKAVRTFEAKNSNGQEKPKKSNDSSPSEVFLPLGLNDDCEVS